MKILHEWNFHNRVCRVVESEPGIVHFEEATRTTGDPSIMLFNYTPTPKGAANEIIQLSMALAEANVINRDLSAAIRRWQEERNSNEKEIEALRNKLKAAQCIIDDLHSEEKKNECDIEELRAELADWRESARKASGERCEDEIHCCCVPYLRVEIAALRKELEG